jgi:hypothetical protein
MRSLSVILILLLLIYFAPICLGTGDTQPVTSGQPGSETMLTGESDSPAVHSLII